MLCREHFSITFDCSFIYSFIRFLFEFSDLYFSHFSLFYGVFEGLEAKYNLFKNKCLIFIYIYIDIFVDDIKR